MILTVVHQGSILDPILFNIFLNNIFLWLKNADLHNFVDDNTVATTCNNLTSLCQTLKKESKSAMDWFKNNSMIANPDRFEGTILSKHATDATHKLTIYDNEIEATKSVRLLGVEIDYQIKFNEDISTLCSKAAMQLNALYRRQKNPAIINNFSYSNFNYCPLV